MFCVQIEGDRALVAGDRLPEERLIVLARAPAPLVVADPGLLDLDDVGAEVAQVLGGPGAGHEGRDIDHALAGEHLRGSRAHPSTAFPRSAGAPSSARF